MNSEKDSIWLSELTEDFLNEAIIWPKLIVKPMHLLGMLFTIISVYALLNGNVIAYTLSIIAAVLLSKKVAVYQEDIKIITNELLRRRKEN
jgi:hypothetical protein